MTDHELNILMQSLSDEELGGLYASLPETADAAAADRVASRFYAKCAAAGMPVARPKTAKPRIKVKYLGFSAAACVAVMASAAAYYNSQAEKPGIIQETVTTAASESVTSYTETVTTALTAAQTAHSAEQTADTTSQTAASTAPAASQTEESAAQTTAAVTSASETAETSAVKTKGTTASSQTATTGTTFITSTTTTTAGTAYTTGVIYSTTRVITTTMPHSETYATKATAPVTSTTRHTQPTESEYHTETYAATSAYVTTRCETEYHTTYAVTNKGDVSSDHAAIWLVHAPYCNTYHVGEDIDLAGTRLGVWYLSCEDGVLENEQSLLLSDHPEMFTVDTSAYRKDCPGTYAIRVIYDRGKALGSSTPAAAKSINIFVTVIE